MLHLESEKIRRYLFKGKFGLEKEGLRVLEDGSMAQTPHPFPDDSHLTRDFSENQTEINTSAEPTAEGAVQALLAYEKHLGRTLAKRTPAEYIWPFSNPPVLRGEEDIPVARFTGALAEKTAYRHYLAGRYGKYKMTFSGIHVNFSFSGELLREEKDLQGCGRTRAFRDRFYLELAGNVMAYSWLPVLLTAASPVLDGSYFEPEAAGSDVFTGMASVRCSELGYWNAFVPVLDYTDPVRYADSIQKYVDEGMLYSASELYYPVRLKPRGENSLQRLRDEGVDHIELRMFDVNPLEPSGLDVRDVRFVQLFLIWLASLPACSMPPRNQVFAMQNCKNAAHYDLEMTRIVMPDPVGNAGTTESVNAREAAMSVLGRIRDFYTELEAMEKRTGCFPVWIRDVLDFETDKILYPAKRYAAQVRRSFSGSFLEKGMEHAIKLQRDLIET